MKRTLVAVAAVSLLVLTGCSAGPSRDDVEERFEIELQGQFGETADVTEMTDLLTGYALDGDCSSDELRDGFGPGGMLVAWEATCLMYFEGDMSDDQIASAKQTVADAALEDAG